MTPSTERDQPLAARHQTSGRTPIWLVALSLLVVLWANAPYLAGVLTADQQHTFSGFFIFEQDGFSYLAKMRQGTLPGNWLFHLPYTTETHDGVYIFVFYLLAGKATHGLNLPLAAGYHLLRLLGLILVIAAGIRFVNHFSRTDRWRLVSWVLILLGSGAGWLISTFDPRYISFISVSPDAFLFSVLFGPPHISLGLALLLWLALDNTLLLKLGLSARPKRKAAWLAVGGFVLALCRPEYVAILLGVIGAYWLGLSVRRRRFLLREAVPIGSINLPATGYAAYVWFVSRTNPAMAAWTAQNPFETPPLGNLLVDIGPFLLLGLLGLVLGRWWQDETQLFLVTWLAALPVLLYLPLSLSRRLIGGAQFAWALAGGYWIDAHLIPWLGQERWRLAAVGPLLTMAALIMISYPLLSVAGATSYVASQPASLFVSADESAAFHWLDGQPGRPVVLCAEQTGNRIPAYSDGVPVLGHPIETLAVAQKRSQVALFYAPDTGPAERQRILSDYGVNLVWLSPAERALGGSKLREPAGFAVAFEQGEVLIWAPQ